MDLRAIAEALAASGISEWMRSSLRALPVIESIHVMAVSVVYGTIVMVDLRLLGVFDVRRPFTRVFAEITRLTWVAFATAAVTGSLMFMPNATTYIVNTAFGLKMAALLCAGVNVALFQFTTLRTVASWDTAAQPPLSGRLAGAISIVIWSSVIVFGRWIGFTKGYDYTVPEDLDLDFLDGCLRCFGGSFLG